MRVEQLLAESAAKTPHKIAVIAGDQRLSYTDLDEASTRLANGLRMQGMKRGDRAVLFLDNCAEAVIGLFGVLKAGGVFSIVNSTAQAGKLGEILNNSDATVLITHSRFMRTAAAAIQHAPTVAITIVSDMTGEPSAPGGIAWSELIEKSSQSPIASGGIDMDLAMIIYTSGSMGHPKGVMITHRNIVSTATSIASYLENSCDDVVLCVLPISFGYGLYQVFVSVLTGATVILEKGFTFPAAVLQKLRDEKVTGFPLVPTIAAILLQMDGIEPDRFPTLRYITNAAAAMPVAHVERLVALFPNTKLYSMYGLTECMRALYMPPDELLARPGSVGKAIPNTEAHVVDENGERVAPGVVGELVIRGPHVMKGYWRNPDETAKRLRPGKLPWEKALHTGDLFQMDEDGYLYFVSRRDDIIKSRGEKVAPKEVENALYMLEGVKEAAVVGVPDPILGMAIKAIMVKAEFSELTEKQVIGHCAAHLEDYMIPRSIEFRTELPKTDSGKIRRSEVQAEELRAYHGPLPH